jgi:hypothetical protein
MIKFLNKFFFFLFILILEIIKERKRKKNLELSNGVNHVSQNRMESS